MKVFATFLLISLSFLGYTQDPAMFICKNVSEVRQLSDSIALNAKTPFRFVKAESDPPKSNIYVVTYEEITDSTKKIQLFILFNIYMKGADVNLDKPGIQQYSFSVAYGKYLDLFPFWKKFINQNAQLEVISKKGYNDIRINPSTGKYITFNLQKETKKWAMRILGSLD